MASESNSEDEFPNIEVVVERRKQKTTGKELSRGKESGARRTDPPKTAQTNANEEVGKTPATTRRRRKLGQAQPVDSSLTKPWQGLEMEMGTAGRVPSARQPSRAQAGVEETRTSLAGELLDRLPVKSKHAGSRVVTGGVKPDSPPPEEPKRTRRLISRGEKKALEQKAARKELDWIVSSDESESEDEDDSEDDIPLPSEDEESDFILERDSDSDNLSMSPPQRSPSPIGPRRVQRRILSSSTDPSKKDPAWAKPIQDDPITKPKKRSEKQSIPKVLATRVKTGRKGNLEDAFEKLKIFNEESEPDEPATKPAKAPVLEPMTPRKNLPPSPAKGHRIPDSPWKPEHKEFWDPEVNFAWIDEHSPPKKPTSATTTTTAKGKANKPGLPAPDSREELRRRYGTSPEKKEARRAFDGVKEDLARDFLAELDEAVTGGRLGRLTESTGGLRVVWSNTLLTTAGRAHWKCKTTTTTISKPPSTSTSTSASASTSTSSPSSSAAAATTAKAAITKKMTTTTQHYASIELATKVLSNESDLLNTVAHEFCHLAVFLLHGKPKLAHGAEFKTYGRRVMNAAGAGSTASSSSSSSSIGGGGKKGAKRGEEEEGKGEGEGGMTKVGVLRTPRDRGVEINVTTRHSYEIEYRFVWRCADCAAEVRRHSRSVDPLRQRCGRCKGGVLVQVKPVPRGGGNASTTATTTTANTSKNDDNDGGGGGGGGGVRAGTGTGAGAQKTERKKSAYQEFTSVEMRALAVSHKGLSFGEKMAVVSARWAERQKKAKEERGEKEEEEEEEEGVKKGKKKKKKKAAGEPGVGGLTASVEVLTIEDEDEDGGDSDGRGAAAAKKEKKKKEKQPAYDIFA
ncbi:putative hmg box-containing protein [Rosellinia necatrix]|uniref:Putative hmg box-containing protein n=1 Tax=Rosellinia necatrix TaxID=77044 RepID=A0A1S7UP38_ROSNE|nr:putative hmg box-containing protein [Rosellinia necatrix]